MKASEFLNIIEGKCPGCHGTGEEEVICSTCDGSGEGRHDGQRCSNCKGGGKVKRTCPDCQGDGEVSTEKCRYCGKTIGDDEGGVCAKCDKKH